MSESIEEKYRYVTDADAIRNTDHAAGPHVILPKQRFAPSLSAFATFDYPPSLLKAFDEPIVNVIDHAIKNSGKVSYMKVNISKDGIVVIENDGPGIETDIHAVTGVPVPTMIFGMLNQGSNAGSGKLDDGRVCGGANGLGIKITNIFSSWFKLETVYRGSLFTQMWRRGMNERDPHTMIPYKGPSFTRITFAPDWQFYKYASAEALVAAIKSPLLHRLEMASIFANYFLPTLKITFNDNPVKVSAYDVCKNVSESTQMFRIPTSGCPWYIDIALKAVKSTCLSNVNGLYTPDGDHLDYVRDTIVSEMRSRAVKTYGEKAGELSFYGRGIFLMINCQIPHPGWTSQAKEYMEMDKKVLKAKWPLPQDLLNWVWSVYEPIIMEKLNGKKKSKPINKYRPAELAGKQGHRHKCGLLICEGDSAMTQVIDGICQNKNLGSKYYGVLSSGGVIVNVRKEAKIYVKDGRRIVEKSTTLKGNLFYNNFLEIIGLQEWCDYSNPDDISKLNYGSIIGCVDQDLDGYNIFGLILNIFDFFWPNLIKAGFLKRLNTPIIRGYPKRGSQVLKFYTQVEYNQWIQQTGKEADYEWKYYKGLATHSDEENISMFADFHEHLMTYTLDDTKNMFDVYYGRDADQRKEALSETYKEITPDIIYHQKLTKQIKCDEHLTYEVEQYQRDNVDRKLPSAVDGFVQSSRKIFFVCQSKYGSRAERVKVANLAGIVSSGSNYHHGDSGLAKSISKKAFVAIDGRQLPMLVPLSQLGTRQLGGADAGSDRYVWVKFNDRIMNLIYNPQDLPLLTFHYEEGQYFEPYYYVPIIPMAICDKNTMPGTGWKIHVTSRDALSLIDKVERMIWLDTINAQNVISSHIPICTQWGKHKFRGTIHAIGDSEWSVGCISVDGNTFHITELPIGVWTKNYIDDVINPMREKDRDLIAKFEDMSNSDIVNIRIKMNAAGMRAIEQFVPNGRFGTKYEQFFGLVNKLQKSLNMVSRDVGSVISFDRYVDVLKYWFPIRKEYYALRVERQCMIYEMQIEKLRNIIRYLNESNDLQLATKSIGEISQTLENRGFTKMWSQKITGFLICRNDEYIAQIKGPRANYDYLIDLSDRSKSSEAIKKREQELESLVDEYKKYKSRSYQQGLCVGGQLWLDELKELRTQIVRGRDTNWQYESYKKYVL